MIRLSHLEIGSDNPVLNSYLTPPPTMPSSAEAQSSRPNAPASVKELFRSLI
jgi:hypothetical protein